MWQSETMRAPYTMRDVELTEPLAPIVLAPAEGGAHVLLRHRRRPVGRVWLSRAEHGARISAETLAALVEDAVRGPVSAIAMRDALLRGARPAPTPLLTIAVCTRNRAMSLRRCLASLVAMRDAGSERGPGLDILVVDSAPSDDRTRQAAADFPGVRYASEPVPGVGRSRNRALASSDRPWIAYVGDDAVADPFWLECLAEAIVASPEAGCFTGPTVPLALEAQVQLRYEHARAVGDEFDWERYGRERWDDPAYPANAERFGTGACMVFRAEAVRDLGGFDDAMDAGPGPAGGGDLDMFYRVVRAGYRLVRVPGLLVRQERPLGRADLVRQNSSCGRHVMALLRKNESTDPQMRDRQRALFLRWIHAKAKALLRSLLGRGPRPPQLVLAEIGGGIAGYFGARPRTSTRIAARKEKTWRVRPPAPWAMLETDLADWNGGSFAPSVDRPALLVFRYRGTVVGTAHVLPSDLPMTGDEFAAFAASRVGTAISEMVRLGPEDGRMRRLGRHRELSAMRVDGDMLARLDLTLAERRSRPIEVTASIVICTRHRPQDLAMCLASIRDEIASGREVVVVDNGPDRATEAAARAHPGVRYVAEPRPGLSRARNAGIAAASGDVVVFIDDDVRPEAGWIEPLLRRFAEPDVSVVCGLVLPDALETEAQIGFQYQLGFGGMGVLPLRFDADFVADWRRGVPAWNIGAGANMAIRRRAALDLGGFDERIGPGAAGGCGDDSEFWHRALFAGQSAIYEPLSVVRHRHRRDGPALERQAYGYSFGHVVALFAQYARDGDRGDLVRAFIDFPAELMRRVLSEPRRRLAGAPDVLLGAWIKGYFAALAHVRIAFIQAPAATAIAQRLQTSSR